ncbi:MAG: ImmA/IrrE family metallo-endopeptidase [Chloroflexi bacterium]|nr:ImmA/IrrE family metallo-endopeptidase [Chloroflexota bacterium]
MDDVAIDFARGCAHRLFDLLMEVRQTTEPPFRAREYAGLLGVRDIIQADLGDLDALLLPLRDGYRVKVNKSHHPLRQNFSIAHEVGHILLQQALRELPTLSMRDGASHDLSGKVREDMCNMIAAELLMPPAPFTKSLRAFGLTMDSIPLLAKTFETSVPATARRVVAMAEEPCIALRWKLVVPVRCKDARPRLEWAWESSRLKAPSGIKRGLTVSISTTVFDAFLRDSTVAGFESFSLGNIRRPFYIESRAFGKAPKRYVPYVLSLVFPERKKKG